MAERARDLAAEAAYISALPPYDFEPGKPIAALYGLIALQGFSHWEIAAKAGISASTFCRIMKGRRQALPSEERWIARALDVPVEEIFRIA